MDENSAHQFAKLITKISAYFRMPIDREETVKYCLKNPRANRSFRLRHALKVLYVKIKNVQPLNVHRLFWNTAKGMIKKSIDVLAGKETNVISKRLPWVPSDLKKKERSKDIRNVLRITEMKCPVPFWFAAPELYQHSTEKIAEGSFAEIYEIRKRNGEKRILKIVPVADVQPEDDELQLTFKQMSGEIFASLELSKLSHRAQYSCTTYPTIYNISVVQDVFPSAALSSWKSYNSKERTDHPCPDTYPIDQAFIAIETEASGVNLDNFKLRCYIKALSVFKQVAAGLAVAEEKLEFEHRDLHPGNILLKRCYSGDRVQICLDNITHSIDTYGVKAKIIDFTFSRLKTEDGIKYLKLDDLYDPKPNSEKLFLDHRYIYVKMRDQTKRRWSLFNPRTNIFWLQHIVVNLLEKVQRERKKRSNNRYQRAAMICLTVYSRTCLLYHSAAEFVKEEIFI